MWWLKLHTLLLFLLKDESGTNAVEYALIMTLVGIFIVAGVISMAPELSKLFNSMANCAADVVNCSAATF